MATEKVGILIELENADEALKTLQRIDNTVRELGRKRTMIKLDDGNVESIDDRIKKIQDRLTALRAAKKLNLLDENDVAEMKRLNAELDILKRGLRDGMANAKTFMQTFNGISSKVAHIGSAMQSFGNAVTQLASPFGRIADGMLLGAGYKALNSFTSGLESGFSRYDTMKKYPKLMAEYSTEVYTAEQSVADLDKSVQGLPIALDDAVSLAQRYTLSLGDMERGTQLAIATNNAFLASMTTESQRYQGMMQMQDLLNGKDLNAREWMSLGASMGKAINEIGKEFGYTDKNMGEFRQLLYAGKIDTQEFLKALEKVGTGNGSLVALAQEAKDTYEAFFSRIGTAASRMVYGVIQSLDEVSRAATGLDVNQLLDQKIIPAIDNGTKAIKDWIKAHPDEITNFFKDLSKINIGSLFKGYAQGLGDLAKILDGFAKLAGGKDLSLIGRFFGNGRLIGRGSTIIGGLLKGLRFPIAGILTGGSFLGKLIGGKAGKLGIFGRIASIFGRKKDIEAAGDVAKSIPSVADTFKGAFSALQGLMTAAGAVTLVAGTGFVAFKAAKSILTDLKDMVDLVNGGGWDNVGYVAGGVIAGIGAFTEIFNAIGTALGPQGLLSTAIAGAASIVVTGTAWADTKLVLGSLENVKQTILKFDEIGEAITNMKGISGINTSATSKLQTAVNAIRSINDVLNGKNGGPSSRGEYSQGLPMFSSFRVSGIKNIASAVKQLQKIITNINEVAVMGINPNVPSRMEQIRRAVQSVEKALPGMMSNINGPKNLANNAKNMASGLKGLTSMVKCINSLAAQSVDVGGFATLVQGIKDAMAQLEGMSEVLELNIEVKLSTKFAASVKKVISDINNAKRSISATKSPLSFNIPVTVTFSVSSNAWSAIAQIREARAAVQNAKEGAIAKTYEAKGGMIYRAGGGGVPWRRRGTDTVPAMLTPGEYVHNRRAVNMFGIDFMRKVNNLDVKGAMNELMHRAGHMANINRGATITNNYNNNQKVVINNNGNSGAGFTFKSASRFVGAL